MKTCTEYTSFAQPLLDLRAAARDYQLAMESRQYAKAAELANIMVIKAAALEFIARQMPEP